MKRLVPVAIAGWAAAVGLALFAPACTGNDAREDLDVEDQKNDNSEAIIGVSPDGFPNVAHKCLALLPNVVVGYWTTTDRSVLLIYNDHACADSNIEQPQEIISMIPRSMVTAG